MKKLTMRMLCRAHAHLAFIAPQPGPWLARRLDRAMGVLERCW